MWCFVLVECKRENEECNRLINEVRRLEVELGEAQSQLLAVGFQQESDLIAEKEKCQNEIASLQQLIQGIKNINMKGRLRIKINEYLLYILYFQRQLKKVVHLEANMNMKFDVCVA